MSDVMQKLDEIDKLKKELYLVDERIRLISGIQLSNKEGVITTIDITQIIPRIGQRDNYSIRNVFISDIKILSQLLQSLEDSYLKEKESILEKLKSKLA